MNFDDRDRLELNELCNALVDGVITGTQHARLEAMLAGSEDARRFYIQAMALSASLHDYAGEMQAEAPDAVPENERPAKWRTFAALAAAAALVLAFWIGGWAGVKGDALADHDEDDAIARLSGAKDCEWNGPTLKPGDELHRGQQITLVSGFAEITFDCGAQVTLEGPAQFGLRSAWDAALARGTLKANVPPEAIGFRVSNPDVDVVDLGTEFSMVADKNGGTEVFVIKGAVEVQSREVTDQPQPALVLRENQARRFSSSGASEVRDRDQKLARLARKVSLDRLTGPPNFVHWSFDEMNGGAFQSENYRDGHRSPDARVEGLRGDDLATLQADGRFLRAVRLDGGMFLRTSLGAPGKRRERTVALWVKVPADSPLPQAGAILAWPASTHGPIEISWNRNPDKGALGALRTETGRGFTVGTTSLRDGRWHHLAVVFSAGKKGDGMQLRQYVDGKLEVVSAKRGPKRGPTSPDADADTLLIGRGKEGTRFRGELDELFLADRALTPQEIRQLMHRNRPTATEPLASL